MSKLVVQLVVTSLSNKSERSAYDLWERKDKIKVCLLFFINLFDKC